MLTLDQGLINEPYHHTPRNQELLHDHHMSGNAWNVIKQWWDKENQENF